MINEHICFVLRRSKVYSYSRSHLS